MDYEETFAPTSRYTSIQCVPALAAHNKCPIFQMDVESAFLNGYLKDEVYIEQPPCFKISERKIMVYRLDKALYGLKQTPKSWYDKIDAFFLPLGFSTVMLTTICLSQDGLLCLILLYIDLLITRSLLLKLSSSALTSNHI